MHAPIKTARMKSRDNPWITREIINRMYERDQIHDPVIRSGDPVLMDHYRKLRNTVTEMIKQNKKYFQDIDNTSRSNHHKFGSELTIPKINKRSIPKTTTANEFNTFFKNVPDKLSALCDKGKLLLWKSAQSVHTFKFHDISRNDVLKLLQPTMVSLPTHRSQWNIRGSARISMTCVHMRQYAGIRLACTHANRHPFQNIVSKLTETLDVEWMDKSIPLYIKRVCSYQNSTYEVTW